MFLHCQDATDLKLSQLSALINVIIFGKIHFCLYQKKSFLHEIKCNGMISFLDFMMMGF